MSREAVSLLKGAGYTMKKKLGRQKFISVFRSMNSAARIRRKRAKLITKLIGECYADHQITKRLKRHDDLTDLALRVHRILLHPEYRDVKGKNDLRYTIAQLLVDSDHRERVEGVLKENKKRNWPEYRPICKAKNIKEPRTVIKTIFAHLDKAWNYERGRYYKNKAGIKFQKVVKAQSIVNKLLWHKWRIQNSKWWIEIYVFAVRDMLSKDWTTNYCLLAGYVPVMKEQKLGRVGKTIGETCGCRPLDKFAIRKSYLKKIHQEAKHYRYHTMKRSLKRVGQRSVIKLQGQHVDENNMSTSMKRSKPGVWTRVFKGTSATVSKAGAAMESSTSALALQTSSCMSQLSERAFAARHLLDISSPVLTNKDVKNVAIKAFVVTPDLPLKFLPARILTFMELTTLLDHPNIVRFIESFATNSEIFVVMPYAENRSLNHIINSHGRLMQKTAQVWTFQIAMAIQYLHSAGIIHRNIKCSNILITENFDALLSGFGSAKVKWIDLLHLQETESTNYHAGYRPYRAPEVLQRRPYFLPPIDVWGLGVVLFRMLNNCFPYCYHNKYLLCRQQHTSKWRKTWRRVSPVSGYCSNLLKKMLEPNPAKRIKINGVVNHCWFTGLPIPKSHRNAVRKAALLFLPKKLDEEDEANKITVTKQVSHKDTATTLDEIHSLLEHMTEKSGNRHFQPLETHAAYKDCYAKSKLRQGTLVRDIDAKLRKRIKKTKRPPPPLEYEPYISDQEKVEMQEQTEAGIHELKRRPEQARRFLDAPEMDDRVKTTLKEVVNNIKYKAANLKAKEDELAKKLALFAPKRDASEPRSILTAKSSRSAITQPEIAAGSIGSLSTYKSLRENFKSSPSLTPTVYEQTGSNQLLPKLEFVTEAVSDTDLEPTKVEQSTLQSEGEEEGEEEEVSKMQEEDDSDMQEEDSEDYEDFAYGESEDFED